MTDKIVHIVFQVINFLHNHDSKKYKLLPIDKLILITLASHKGIKGIFPMQETLAIELDTSLRYMKTRLKFLEKSGLIFVEKINRKNYYHLLFLSTIGDLQITHHEKIGDPQITSQVIHRSPHRGSTDATNNKVSNKVSNRERRRTKRATTLSDDFVLNRETIDVAQNAGLTEEEATYEWEKFEAHYKANGVEKMDWQACAQEWFIRAGGYKRRQKGKDSVSSSEIRSTVPDYVPPEIKGTFTPLLAKEALGNILNKLGGRPNGLGNTEKGKGKETR